MFMYIHDRNEWPHFTWDQSAIGSLLADVRYLQGRLLGRMDGLGLQLRDQATLETLTQDVLKTSEIEGEKLDLLQVRSSIAKRLGMDVAAAPRIDRNVEGIVEVLLDATHHYNMPLTEERLFGWHAALFPTGQSGLFHRITVGAWRTESSGVMQVVSGPYGREKVHYEAPAYDRLADEMSLFIKWFNASSEDLVIKSALAHFWFVTIHPFDDGNGRIARAIADMLLARSEESAQRFYSMSAQIQRDRNAYYAVLEQCQKSTLDITVWMEWFLHCLKKAIIASDKTLEVVLKKAQFWKCHADESFNSRQRLLINRLLDGFNGKLNSSKWAALTTCSQDTALRDINDLLQRKVLVKESAGGRSTSYILTEK